MSKQHIPVNATRMESANYEFVNPYGYVSQTHCGYCSGTRPGLAKRFSYFAIALSLSPEFYQTLLDRYWRRSGTLMYRPNQRDSCCPHYTIRVDSEKFKPSRDQRQAINRFNGYVIGDEYTKEASRLHPRTREQSKRRNNVFEFVERVHEAEYTRLKTPPEPAHKLVITLESDDFTEEKYAVYDNYQKVVHEEEPENRTRSSFERFLCNSPLRRRTQTRPDGTKKRLGSYHQCYRLDGKLVAIGVLDLLPQCVSSVYFLYDESIHRFSPGKLGALQELALAREEGYRWWYPGYYIHDCPKMRYKRDYAPQYILDPVTLAWDPLDKTVLALLDRSPYLSLSQHQEKLETGQQTVQDSVVPRDGARDESPDDEDETRTSLFAANMPGIPRREELEDVDMDQIRVICDLYPLRLTSISNLVNWSTSSLYEMVAAMGVDTPPQLCIDAMRLAG